MPFLFVDYDQGAGGEHFCNALSQAPQCEKIFIQVFDSGRTKVHDFFNQEFLKPEPAITDISLAPDNVYRIVPTHQHVALANRLLGPIKSIRIQQPSNGIFWQFQKHQQIKKVLLAVEPTDQYFIGFLQILKNTHNNTKFLSRVKRSMDNLSLTLLALGQEPTEANRQNYLEQQIKYRVIKDPDYPYDLYIPYETLITDADWVVNQIKEKFDIDVDIDLFKKYKHDFENYQAQT
jgi:hypothetical protein